MKLQKKNRTKKALAVLAFHKIGEPTGGDCPTWNYVPVDTFVSYIRYLEKDRWQVIDLATFLRGVSEPDTLPDKAALLTFDDGYRSIYTEVLPLLIRFGYPAVVFVPTDYIGTRNIFDKGIEPEESICSWNELMELESNGISVQSHGTAHSRFSLSSMDEQRKEISDSRLAIQRRLENTVEVFSFPYGDVGTNWEETRKALVKEGYRAAFLYGRGVNTIPTNDPFLMQRLAIGPDTRLQTEILKS
jgi:peptidoglycan/xylan/chitin deacetylase (PgdA/CDA1 family)